MASFCFDLEFGFQARRWSNHLPQSPRLPRTTIRAIQWKVPRIANNSISLAFYDLDLNLAQRAFCAAAIFARASALNVRRFLGLASKSAGLKLVALPLTVVAAVRPGLRLTWPTLGVSAKSALTCCSREISASIASTISFVFMNPPLRE
jgi:hypothetical protein